MPWGGSFFTSPIVFVAAFFAISASIYGLAVDWTLLWVLCALGNGNMRGKRFHFLFRKRTMCNSLQEWVRERERDSIVDQTDKGARPHCTQNPSQLFSVRFKFQSVRAGTGTGSSLVLVLPPPRLFLFRKWSEHESTVLARCAEKKVAFRAVTEQSSSHQSPLLRAVANDSARVLAAAAAPLKRKGKGKRAGVEGVRSHRTAAGIGGGILTCRVLATGGYRTWKRRARLSDTRDLHDRWECGGRCLTTRWSPVYLCLKGILFAPSSPNQAVYSPCL
jgi:hypothetical protein